MISKLNSFLKMSRDLGLVPTIEASKYRLLQSLKLQKSLNPPKYSASKEITFLQSLEPKPLIGSYKDKTITWIMPDFTKGSGGHRTIFRFAKYFELRGYTNKFIVCNYGHKSNRNTQQREETLNNLMFQNYFSAINTHVTFYDSAIALLDNIDAINTDFVIGTDMKSQLIAMNVAKANRRLSFMQDDEPRFQPAGTLATFMHAHYSQEDNEFICAGEWLASLLEVRRKFTFKLGVDSLRAVVFRQSLRRTKQQSSKVKIAVYSRSTTERRCVELTRSYLDRLHQIGEEFEVHEFGHERREWVFPYPTVHHGVLSSTALYRLLLECDICIALSATNYSLLPNEAMSVGAVAVDLDTPSNRMVYGHGGVKLIGPEVAKAANQLREIIDQCRNEDISGKQIDLRDAYEQDLSWETQEKSIYEAVFSNDKPELVKVSVCIPTRNAGPEFELLLFSLQKQALVELELCIIDTESDDETLNLAYRYFPDANVRRITKAEFGHGKTRNELAEMASNEYIVFLTQDAIPLDELLVVSLAMHVSKDPKICGSFCSHTANPSHSRFIAHSMQKQFELIAGGYSARNFAADKNESLKYKFFSTNCALVKRSLILDHPFENVVYGEDQIWAFQMLRRGFGTAFVPDVSIMHSHSYEGDDLVAMTKTDLEFYKFHFGVFPKWSQKKLDRRTDNVAAEIGASPEEIRYEKGRNALKMRAYELAKTSDQVTYSK